MSNIVEPFSNSEDSKLYPYCQEKVNAKFRAGLIAGYSSGYEDALLKEYNEFSTILTCICEYWYAVGYELGYDIGYSDGYTDD